MTDFKFDPNNGTHIAAFRAMDEYHRMEADIEALPVTSNEIQFKFPDIRTKPEPITGTILAMSGRRINETDEEWASRCVIMTGIGDPKK